MEFICDKLEISDFNARNHKTAKALGCSWSVDYDAICLFLPYRQLGLLKVHRQRLVKK
jgi:hypothetical protein